MCYLRLLMLVQVRQCSIENYIAALPIITGLLENANG
jgi:hypothetical protein